MVDLKYGPSGDLPVAGIESVILPRATWTVGQFPFPLEGQLDYHVERLYIEIDALKSYRHDCRTSHFGRASLSLQESLGKLKMKRPYFNSDQNSRHDKYGILPLFC